MSRVSVTLVVGVLAALNATAWALITPAFQGPDEEAHVAYAQHLGQTGELPDREAGRPFASTEMRRALVATRLYPVIAGAPDTRPPWREADDRAYERATGGGRARRDDGGGYTGASRYSPIFYLVPAGVERLGGGSFFDRLFGMRLLCALLAGVTAALVCATVRELLPAARWPAVAAGLLVAFQPMFGFISGTVNSDAGAATAGTALLYLAVRALRRGLTARLALAIGVVLVVGTLVKANVLALAPAVVLALLILVRRHRAGRGAVAAAAGAAAALMVVWIVAAGQLDRADIPGAGGQAVAPERSLSPEPVGFLDRVAYVWQVFLPRLPFMEDVYTGQEVVPAWTLYVERAWASFGWNQLLFPRGAYHVFALGMAVVLVLLAVAARREWPAVRARAAEIAVLATAFISLAIAMHLAFARAQPTLDMLEQSRYLFPALTAVAVAAIGACYAFGRRWAPLFGTALVSGMMLLSGLSQFFVFTKYYT
jgi:4-amino-4-deoxy-L-arabinose transferase-like glycosyltransferase